MAADLHRGRGHAPGVPSERAVERAPRPRGALDARGRARGAHADGHQAAPADRRAAPGDRPRRLVGRPPLEDYALLGDCHSAALVSRRGSIDWLCLPRFDSDACFAALLGEPGHGRWSLTAAGDADVQRRYLPGTLVLETSYRTTTGACRVLDCMVVDDEHPTLLRVVEGIEGAVELCLELIIGFDYGSTIPWVRKLDAGGIEAIAGPSTLRLYTEVPLRGRGYTTVGEFTVHAGERRSFTLVW